MSNDVEHLFICLLAIRVSSLETLKSFSRFWISLCCCILGILYRFWILTPYRICGLWIFPPPWGLPFHSVHSVFHCTKFKKLNEPSLSVFSFVTCVFGVISKKSLPNPMLWSFCPMFHSKSFTVLCLGPWSIFSWLLYVVLGKGPPSFFCMWIRSFRGIIC